MRTSFFQSQTISACGHFDKTRCMIALKNSWACTRSQVPANRDPQSTNRATTTRVLAMSSCCAKPCIHLATAHPSRFSKYFADVRISLSMLKFKLRIKLRDARQLDLAEPLLQRARYHQWPTNLPEFEPNLVDLCGRQQKCCIHLRLRGVLFLHVHIQSCTWFCRGRKETTNKCTIRGFDSSTVQRLAASDSKSLRRRCVAARARQNALAPLFQLRQLSEQIIAQIPASIGFDRRIIHTPIVLQSGWAGVSSREPLRYQDGLVHICACQLHNKVGLSVLA